MESRLRKLSLVAKQRLLDRGRGSKRGSVVTRLDDVSMLASSEAGEVSALCLDRRIERLPTLEGVVTRHLMGFV